MTRHPPRTALKPGPRRIVPDQELLLAPWAPQLNREKQPPSRHAGKVLPEPQATLRTTELELQRCPCTERLDFLADQFVGVQERCLVCVAVQNRIEQDVVSIYLAPVVVGISRVVVICAEAFDFVFGVDVAVDHFSDLGWQEQEGEW